VTPEQIREDAERLRKEAISLRIRGHISVADALDRSAACLLALADYLQDAVAKEWGGDSSLPAQRINDAIARHLRTAEENDR
jgi:hypothetical protein